MKERSVLKERLLFILYNLFVVIVFFGLSEGILAYWLKHPGDIPHALLPAFRAYYKQHLRSTIQMEPSCAVYDPELFYTLRPGKSSFNNVEFNTQVSVNSMGVRDDEESLEAPEVILLGDSYTMGWGIEQDSIYGSLMEQALKKTVLNAGISSYGTARELTILKRFNDENLKTVVIQYNESDLDENRSFVSNGDSLVISSRETYEKTSDRVRNKKGYFFGKHTALLTKFFLKDMTGRLYDGRATGAEDVAYFMKVLRKIRVPDSLNIVVFELSDYGRTDNEFIPELQRVVKNNALPFPVKSFKVLDVQQNLGPEDYFILDNHINVSGHRKISSILASVLDKY